MFALTLLYKGQAFRKIQVLPAKYSISHFGDKCRVIPTLNSKYMSCLRNATLSINGNVPCITLRVRKILGCMISPKIKFLCKIIRKFQADKMFSIYCF